MKLSGRAYNGLIRSKVVSVGQMMALTKNELLAIKNIGSNSVEEILDYQNKIKNREIDFSNITPVKEKNLKTNCVSNIKMIEKAIPSLIGQNIGEVYFKNRHGIYQLDYLIKEVGFSVRTMNCLLRASIKYISEVAFSEFYKIKRIKNLGKSSIDEILEYLKTSVNYTIMNQSSSLQVGELCKKIETLITEECPEFDMKRYRSIIERRLIELNMLKETIDIDLTELMTEIFNSECFLKEVEKTIVYSIDSSEKEISQEVLFKDYPFIFKKSGLGQKVLTSLEQREIIERYKRGYRAKLQNIEEWIETLYGNMKTAIKLRLEGKTLQEAGDIMNLSKERIRQLIDKACRLKPRLKEDDLGYWYSEYGFDDEAMEMIFGANTMVKNYLAAFYRKGNKNIEEIVDDTNIDASLYERVHSYLYRNSILIGNKYVPCKRELLCREVAKQMCSNKDILSYDLYDIYMDILEKNNLQNNEKLLFPSSRAFEARIQDSKYILMKYGHKIRYYVIGEHDVNEMINKMNFERFVNIEISTLKLFREYPELMDEFDIRDEYELHNFLKKTEGIWNLDGNVSVKRMPYLMFGKADRRKQTENLLYQLAPISIEEFCEAFENEYGVLSTTANANMVPLISNYLHDGVFSVNQPILSKIEKKFLSDILIGDFYFTEDIRELFVEKFGKKNSDHLNPRAFKELGYRVYTNYLVSNKFASSSEYFYSMITRNSVFDQSILDRRIIYVQQFNMVLDSLRNSLEMIEYDEGKYLRYTHFLEALPEYDKQALTDYITETLEYAEGSKFFTIKSLVLDGYDHPLHHIGFGEWFNCALLKNSKRISFVRTGGTILFYEGNTKRTTVDFLRHVLQDIRSIDIYDLLDLLQDDYGISMFKEKIIQLVKDSELYYDATMEKLYLNKEYFYEEL